MSAVYLDYSQDQLDKAYDQRAWAPNAGDLIARFADLSAEVRASHAYRADIRYGAGADETLDWFPAENGGRAVHIHLHGGAWRNLSKLDVSFAAPAFTSKGIHFVAPDFSNLPAVRMPVMIDQLVRAVAFVFRNAAHYGGDPQQIFISGHSSGAHLCAVLLTQDWTRFGLPGDLLKGAVCISGSYDLAPVLLSSRRQYVDLTVEEALQFSPVRHADAISCPVEIVYGEHESPEFVRQAEVFAAALACSGRSVGLDKLRSLNHFETALELGRPGSAVLDKALVQFRSNLARDFTTPERRS